MKPTSAHNTALADDARMMDDDAKDQTEEGRSALQAAPIAPIHAAASAEHKHSHSSSSSMDESKQPEAAATDPTPAPSTRRSKRVRESQYEAAAVAADPLTAPSATASSAPRSSKQARTAATSSVQPQKAASASANKNGSGSRGSRAEPEQDEAAPEAAAVAAASSASKRKPAAAASSKPAASSKATVASAASSRPSPCSRLDADSLGVALSCLDANEFLVARLVSKQWLAASAKRTAWPQLQVDDFIRLMQNDAYDDPSRRRLVVNTDDKLRSFVLRFSSHASKDVFGKHASEVKLEIKSARSTAKLASQQTLLRSVFSILSSQFQFLSALTLDGCELEQGDVMRLYTTLAPRLRSLILSQCSSEFHRQLPLLSELRVLVLSDVPPAESLIPLHHLRYLHMSVEDSALEFDHACVIRWLAAQFALRSLSIRANFSSLIYLWALFSRRAPASPIPVALMPSLQWSVPIALADLSLSLDRYVILTPRWNAMRWDAMPDLRRLQFNHRLQSGARLLEGVGMRWYWEEEQDEYDEQQHVSRLLARVESIVVNACGDVFNDGFDLRTPLRQLQGCQNLHSLHFDTFLLLASERRSVAAVPLQPLLRAWSATIEEIRLGVEVRIEFFSDSWDRAARASYKPDWSALAACKRLRVLELELQPSMPDPFVRALSSLPAFHTLELSHHGDIPRMPSIMLRCMLESASWNVLHMHSIGYPPPREYVYNPLQPKHQDGLSQQLTQLQAKEPAMLTDKRSDCIRLFASDHCVRRLRVVTYRIVTDEASSARVWESDERSR